METLLLQTRRNLGLRLEAVAQAVGTNPGNLSRIERGLIQPKKVLARALFQYYGGVVPLGLVYDPSFGRPVAPPPPPPADDVT